MWRSYIGQPRSKQGQCPRQTARNHNKNRQHSLRFKWTLLFRPHRLGVLSRLLQGPKRKKHMQTVCLKSVCVQVPICLSLCVCACACAIRKEKMLTNCSQRRLFLAVVIQRAVSLLSVPVFIAVAVAVAFLGFRSALAYRQLAPEHRELSRLKQRRNFAAFQVESVAKVFGQQRKLHAERTR